ncbi:hypothetical protein HMPREF9081_0689 [Centipeda periodontii DSM 2778]|uniref:Uncharacterized protein n=1 Tax=Centipeda periodontii DSM 2778 TaxID=888060 RepID=F5RKA4_9FIRM|nr:hypothetical protein HMPREF9081_0689 [Centipeda periodontii DSM 2778]
MNIVLFSYFFIFYAKITFFYFSDIKLIYHLFPSMLLNFILLYAILSTGFRLRP